MHSEQSEIGRPLEARVESRPLEVTRPAASTIHPYSQRIRQHRHPKNPAISTNANVCDRTRVNTTYNLAFKSDIHATGRLMKVGGCHKTRPSVDREQDPDKNQISAH